MTSLSGLEFPLKVSSEAFPERQSRAEGVSHISARLTRVGKSSSTAGRRSSGFGPLWSEAVGVGHVARFRQPLCFIMDGASWLACVVGVGSNDPDPIASVWCAKGGSGYTMPLSIIPERSERPEHFVQSSRPKGCDVFEEEPLRLDFPREPGDFVEQAGSLPVKAGTLPGEGDVLAGEAPAYEVGALDPEHVEQFGGESAHVFKAGHLGPAGVEHRAAVGVDFAERDGAHPRPVEPEGEATYPGKEV